MSMGDLANRLAGGQSPSQALATSGNEAATAGMADLEKIAKSGDLNGKNGPLASGGTMTSGGGGGAGKGGGAAGANPFGAFGMKGPAGANAPSGVTFDKAKRDLAASDAEGDVFHENFHGTIFQIVSGKLDKTRDRIDQLEWETPLNRALLGLPAKKTLGKP
jgi:hypothetical protein